jgi:hypothetical protein
MENSEVVLAVKFKSTFDAEELLTICQEDLETFRNVPDLLQKYYISEEGTGALSGIYIFKNRQAREAFLGSSVAKAIPARYGVIPDTFRVEYYGMAIVLKDTLVDC